MFLANDCPNISPMDSGINERCKFIRYHLRYIPNPVNKDERLADPDIKVRIGKDEYKNALFHLISDTYKNMVESEAIIGGYIKEPKCVIQETKEWIKDEITLFHDKLNEKFEITNDPKDCVECRLLVDYFIESCNMKISAVKIGRNISSLIELEDSHKNIGKKKYRIGIKQI